MMANASKNAKVMSLKMVKSTHPTSYANKQTAQNRSWSASSEFEPGSLCCLTSAESSADPGPEATKMEVSLTLTNKFDIFNECNDKPDARALLLR